MAHLTLAGLSDDGKRLLLVNDQGDEFTLDVDARLRAALRGEHARLGQLEIQMESALRPRDIQMRIRAGESPEAVAHAAGTSVEKIMAFAAPVMAERAHVADRAQLASVRRRASESGARTLGEAVAAQLRAHNVDPGSVDLSVEDNSLTVRAHRTTRPQGEGMQVVVAERPSGEFVRQLFLGEGLDTGRIEATYDQGVLTLHIPVAERAKR